MRLTVLGARGSLPVSGKEYDIYGGDTSCYMVEAGDYVIFLDAGTGIIKAPKISEDKEIVILLSHPHMDHLLGLPFLKELTSKDRKITLYGRILFDKSTAEQINGLFDRLYWPVTPFELASDFECVDSEFPLILKKASDTRTRDALIPENDDHILIETVSLPHPGGCLGFKITHQGKKIVYMSDCELVEGDLNSLTDFADKADLLLCDSQYTKEEYISHRGYGHSTPELAIELKEKSNCAKLVMIHHDPFHTDEQLGSIEKKLCADDIIMARTYMRFEL